VSEIDFRTAINQALDEELARDETVVFFGEDVATAGGVFAVTGGLQERFGADPADWGWGRVHRLELVHPLAVGRPALAEVANVGPAALPGSADTLRNAAGAYERGFAVVSGAEYRLLVDFAAEPAGLAVNIAGQSGQPGSPHFADQFEDWAGQGYHPLLIERAAVEEQATARVEIRPG
jgi:penicillin amidase